MHLPLDVPRGVKFSEGEREGDGLHRPRQWQGAKLLSSLALLVSLDFSRQTIDVGNLIAYQRLLICFQTWSFNNIAATEARLG